MSTRALIVAHRGLHAVHPENSLPAFAAAWEAGVSWCECDVHHTADGVPVVLHDATLDRTTTGRGPIDACDAASIGSLALKDAPGRPTFANVPYLWDALKSIPPGGGMCVELKAAADAEQVARLVDLIRRYPTLLQSFTPSYLHLSKRLCPSLPATLLIEGPEEIDAATDGPWDAVAAHHPLLDEAVVRRFRKAGKRVGAWTVDEPREMRRVRDLGVDVLITNDPLTAMRL